MFTWYEERRPGPPEYAAEGFSLRLNRVPTTGKFTASPDVIISLGTTLICDLQEVLDRFPDLVTWEFGEVSLRSEQILRDMDRIMFTGKFEPSVCRVSGYAPNPVTLPRPPDAKVTPWKLPIPSTSREKTKHSNPSAGSSEGDVRRSSRLARISALPRLPNTPKRKVLGNSNFQLQHQNPSNLPSSFNALKQVIKISPITTSDYDETTAERLLQHVSTLCYCC